MHTYLRAYMAGVVLPTIVVPLIVVGLTALHPTGHGFHVEDVLIFPIGFVPNAWGLWNMLYLRVSRARRVPIGLFGAGLVAVLAPLGYAVQYGLGKFLWTPAIFAIGLPLTLVVYYLAWKLFVGRFNEILGIAEA